jgi:hypothetical protein
MPKIRGSVRDGIRAGEVKRSVEKVRTIHAGLDPYLNVQAACARHTYDARLVHSGRAFPFPDAHSPQGGSANGRNRAHPGQRPQVTARPAVGLPGVDAATGEIADSDTDPTATYRTHHRTPGSWGPQAGLRGLTLSPLGKCS